MTTAQPTCVARNCNIRRRIAVNRNTIGSMMTHLVDPVPHSAETLVRFLPRVLSVWYFYVLPITTWVSTGCADIPSHPNDARVYELICSLYNVSKMHSGERLIVGRRRVGGTKGMFSCCISNHNRNKTCFPSNPKLPRVNGRNRNKAALSR